MELRFPINILVASVLLNYRRVSGNAEHHRVIIHVPYRVHTIHHTIVKHVLPPPSEARIVLPPAPIVGGGPQKAGDDWYELMGYSLGEPLDMAEPQHAIDYAFDSGEQEHLRYHLQQDQAFVDANRLPLLGARNDLGSDGEWTPSFGLQDFEGQPAVEKLEQQAVGQFADFPSEAGSETDATAVPVPQPWRQAAWPSSTSSSIRLPRRHLTPDDSSARNGYAVHELVND